MNLQRLREKLAPLIAALKDSGTHEMLPTICANLGLPIPGEGSKRERLAASLDALPDSDLPEVAQHLLLRYPPSPKTRNEIQDLLWANSAVPEIPKRYRREIARALAIEDLYLDSAKFNELLDSLWVLI